MQAIDSHFHIWRQKDQPWLVGPMVPRIFGPYEAIRRDYPIEEYLGDCRPCGVTRGVYVQTNWAKEDFEKEVVFVSEAAARADWQIAIVAYADMTVDDVRPQLDRLKKREHVRGVRMQLHWHETPAFRFAVDARQVLDPKVKANVRRLADYAYSFDLQLFPAQMRDGLELVGENPETQFILTHCGMLTGSDQQTVEAWKSGLRTLAQAPNLNAKMSGLGTFEHRNDPALIAMIYDAALEILGSERLMFGSNFPIEKLWSSYSDVFDAHADAAAGHGDELLRNVFWNTAARVYKV